jgi:UDP-N-acetylglucosamine--N-acetylmuramyl-(pentapeptide) pyrophosphoryl-undecaprenol N-acetylglucosamine transferase
MAKKHDRLEKGSGYRLVVAGGGTGGHLFPGIAVAQAFRARHPRNQVLFINAGRPLEVEILSRLGWDQKSIAIAGIKGRGRWQQLGAACKVPGALWCAGRIIKRFKADLVLGVGGYSAGPVVAAAKIKGLPAVLHEQNRLPGVTNRILGRLVDRIYLTFEESREYFDSGKVKVSGNPVRNEILSLAAKPAAQRDDRTFTVLVVGGSQGAHAINQAVMEALPAFQGSQEIRFVHQTGAGDEASVRQAYRDLGVQALVQAFFDEMADHYARADMIICRAGATTVAEITVAGKAAIFVPFPFAADDHQTQNALALADIGAAEMIRQDELNGAQLAKLIRGYMENRILLTEMAAKARALGRPDAAKVIVDDIYRLLEEKWDFGDQAV